VSFSQNYTDYPLTLNQVQVSLPSYKVLTTGQTTGLHYSCITTLQQKKSKSTRQHTGKPNRFRCSSAPTILEGSLLEGSLLVTLLTHSISGKG